VVRVSGRSAEAGEERGGADTRRVERGSRGGARRRRIPPGRSVEAEEERGGRAAPRRGGARSRGVPKEKACGRQACGRETVGPAAVEMGKASRTPENAVERRPRCKMQQLLRLLLEPLQCASDLHFADTDAYKASAGDSLINNPQLLSGSKITWHRTGSRNVMRRFSDRFADSPPVAEAARVGGEPVLFFPSFLFFLFLFFLFPFYFLFLCLFLFLFLVSFSFLFLFLFLFFSSCFYFLFIFHYFSVSFLFLYFSSHFFLFYSFYFSYFSFISLLFLIFLLSTFFYFHFYILSFLIFALH
jgi:hypothetical protein